MPIKLHETTYQLSYLKFLLSIETHKFSLLQTENLKIKFRFLPFFPQNRSLKLMGKYNP